MVIMGIDIGGSGIKGALVDIETGELSSKRHRLPTPELAKPDDVAQSVSELVNHFNYKGVVGCGFPAVIQNGVARTAANVHHSWIGTDVAGLFSAKTGLPVYVLNDADAAGIAEMKFGAGKDQKGSILIITLGTGIGTAMFVDGQLVPNLELGHLVIRGKDAEKRASVAVKERKEMSWSKWGERVQEYLGYLESLMWPDLIIIGGGVSKEAEKFLPYLKIRSKILTASMFNQAGIVGAALFASQRS